MQVKPYLKIIRFKFLSLSLVIGLFSLGLAYYEGYFDMKLWFIGVSSLILLHASVNSLNAASDYRTGIDKETDKTEFSGGIDSIVEGNVSYESARNIGILTLILGILPFVYFLTVYDPIVILAISVVGLVTVVGYTDLFARIGLGEVSAGIGLGATPCFAIFYVQSGEVTIESLYASSLMFILLFNLLLLNEYPDVKADKKNGRVNIPILIGERGGLVVYTIGILLLFAGCIIGVWGYNLPMTFLLTLVPSVFVLPIISNVAKDEFQISEKNLKMNTIWVHLTYVFAAVSFVLPSII